MALGDMMALGDIDPVNPAVEVVRALAERRETLAVVESLTGGMIAATLVDIAGVSSVFLGGLVVYATELKASLAGVPSTLLRERGPVDPDVAIALAEGGRRRCGSDWCLAATGVAGPQPQDGVPVGTVFLATAGPIGSRALGLRLTGGRADVRIGAMLAGLRMLTEQVMAEDPGVPG